MNSWNANAEALVLQQVDQIVAEDTGTLFLALRVITHMVGSPRAGTPSNLAIMGIYESIESAQEVCQRNTRSDLSWAAEDHAMTYWRSQSIRVKAPFKTDDPAPRDKSGQAWMHYVVSEQKVRT